MYFTFLCTTADLLGNLEAETWVVIRKRSEMLLGIFKLISLLCGISLFLLHIFKFITAITAQLETYDTSGSFLNQPPSGHTTTSSEEEQTSGDDSCSATRASLIFTSANILALQSILFVHTIY